ncbi:Plant self-incompatibility protein S1 family [Euphorbia peplus]|nr:Plant self-incompatibility protein S1 family [Euphorbia peplus]
MSSLKVDIAVLAFAISWTLLVEPINGWFLVLNPVHMSVTNELSHNKILKLHCKSKDDDLGIHKLSYNQSFTWKFRPNILGSTHFWCYAAPNRTFEASFDAYRLGFVKDIFYLCKLEDQLDTCVWIAKDDGIYLKDLSAPEFSLLIYSWEHRRKRFNRHRLH